MVVPKVVTWFAACSINEEAGECFEDRRRTEHLHGTPKVGASGLMLFLRPGGCHRRSRRITTR
jgi:hypothetical protein